MHLRRGDEEESDRAECEEGEATRFAHLDRPLLREVLYSNSLTESPDHSAFKNLDFMTIEARSELEGALRSRQGRDRVTRAH